MINAFFFCGLMFLSLSSATAQTVTENQRPLLFEASRNNLEPSPQRFEYRFEDAFTVQVGDIKVNTQDVKISFTETSGSLSARLQWPHSLFEEGEITIVDSAGKALARKKFNNRDLEFQEPSTPDGAVRTTLSQMQWNNLPTNLITRLRQTAFFRFCLNREDGDTKATLCSPESFFQKDAAALQVSMRAPYRQSRIEINNEPVGKQGIIYLNDVSESVRFRAETETGAFLELNTRSQRVEFEDIAAIGDGTRVIITAKGAAPVDLNRIRRLPGDRWQTVLSTRRPILYMRGQGDIPLRQDFQVKGPLPQTTDRVYVDKETPEEVYSSRLIVAGSNPHGTSLKISGNDEQSLLNRQEDKFVWSLEGLESNAVNRYELEVGDKKFITHYDVYRGLPRSLDGGINYDSEDRMALNFDLRWWIEDFLGVHSKFSHLHWGLGLQYKKSLESSDEVNHLNGRLYWRAEPGIQRRHATWGLLADYWNRDAAGNASSLAGVGAYFSQEPFDFGKQWMDWFELEFVTHFLSLSSDDTALEQALHLQAKAFKSLRSDWSYHYGVGVAQVKPKTGNADPQVQVELGLSWLF